jgi:hypothetical protein
LNDIKKILISLIIVLLVLTGLGKAYDFALRHNANNKAAYVQLAEINADLLFHGPCEPLWMISPKAIDKKISKHSYNLALSHSDFADNYLHLYFYLQNNKAPEILFLYVTPESMDRNYNTFNTYRFAPYIGDPVVDSVVKEMDPGYFKFVNIPFMKYAYYSSRINFDALQGLKHYVQDRKQPFYADGYEPPQKVVWDNHHDEFVRLYPLGYYFEWDLKREKYLRKTIELALSRKIRVILYESPVLKEAVAFQPNRKTIIKRIDQVAENYGIKYVRFEEMEIAFSRKYYISALNLNIEGSRIFTDSLAKYINKLNKE